MLISFRNLKLIAEVGMMKHGILLLASEDTAVVKQCHKTLLSLAAYDEGVIILYRYYHILYRYVKTTKLHSHSLAMI